MVLDGSPEPTDRRTNLPAARVVLYGRAAEIERLAGEVLSVPGRLVTITGPGGVGKTSVALAVARRVLPDLHHGAWLVDLSTLTTSRAVPQAVARAMGVRESYAATIDEALTAFLRDRQLLLVMDNCEHVVDACATLLDELLDQAPGLRVLATSREPLRMRGEVTHALPPLAVPMHSPHHEPGHLSEIASVQLFLDRAHGVRPDVELTNQNADTIVEICRRLDGIPLALELAATRVGGLSLEHIADRLRDSFVVLFSDGRSRPARHQTLRATLEWSHDLLSPVERTVFERLGAFAGGWTMPAAEAVCAGGGVGPADVADIVAGLVEKSLVVLDMEDGQTRYRFLEPVRDYAQGQLAASAQSGASRDRHCAYYVALAEQAEPEMHRAQQAVWMRRLDRDLDNLRVAVRTGRARSDANSVLRLTGALWWYLWVRGHLREGLDWIDGLLDLTEVADRGHMAGLRVSAMLLGSLGHSSEAMARATELLALAERTGDVAETARAATLLGLEEVRAAHIDRALPLLERALLQARAVDHPMLTPHALVNLGAIWFELGQPDRAEDRYREGLAYFERVGDGWGIAYATNYLAALVRKRGDHRRAARLSAEAVRWLINLGDRFYLIFAVEDLARARMDGRLDQSGARLLGSAHALRLASGALLSPFSQTQNERDVARLRAALGDVGFDQAWADGTDHPLEVLGNEVEMTLHSTPPATGAELGGPGGLLTARERDVVRLIGRGYSNRQIAEELVVTVGTAGVHIEHILRKLDLRSRHQVADWAKTHGLAPE